ncbi:unnamed protein product [Phytophthora fragariaefolia]|uniref:Unnamed protein product n=1 Tax=Phytophthora fragariaefolia TaxID=1490495 RepID=A0A9W6U571_9STRA|nr:unnamed protein product [Phytophthora fragariaefolia]
MDTYTKVGTGTRLACAPLSLPDWMKVGSQTPFSQSGIHLDLRFTRRRMATASVPKINRVDFTPNPYLVLLLKLPPATTVYASDGTSYPVTTRVRDVILWRRYLCSFRISTPTTQAPGTPAASAAANTVVANSATTGSSPAPTSVVTSTVTTPSSPKRTMSLGEYKKTRGNASFARDELEALFDVGSDADMEDGEEEDEGTSCSRRDDPSVGSRRPREDESDASSSKRSRSGSDRPLADAGTLSSPRSGGDSTSSGTIVSRTGPVSDPWMPTPSEIQPRFGSTAPPSQYALYSCSGIIDDDATKELDFDLATDQRLARQSPAVERRQYIFLGS